MATFVTVALLITVLILLVVTMGRVNQLLARTETIQQTVWNLSHQLGQTAPVPVQTVQPWQTVPPGQTVQPWQTPAPGTPTPAANPYGQGPVVAAAATPAQWVVTAPVVAATAQPPIVPPLASPPLASQPLASQPLAAQPTPVAEFWQTKSRRTFNVNENLVGRNLLPLLAAALGLAGLVFLGIVVVPYLGDTAKIILMFFISLAVGGLGYWLFRRHSSVLTQALTGTGLGGVFVSVLVTHLYFHAVGDIVALTMLAVWTVACLWLAKHTGSLLVAILAHAGMVVSVVMGYAGTVPNDRLMLLMVYQIVVSLAVIVGSYFWVKVTYRFGLFAAQAMVLVSVVAMWTRLVVPTPASVPSAWATAGLLVQFGVACAFAYLLFVSCARVKDDAISGLFGVFNATLWAAILLGTVTALLGKVAADAWGLPLSAVWRDAHTIPLSLTITLVIAFLPVVGLALAGRSLPIRPAVQASTVTSLAAVSAALMLVAFGARLNAGPTLDTPVPTLSWMIAPGLAYLLLSMVTRHPLHTWIARTFVAADAALMLMPGGGYRSLTSHWTLWASLGYLAVLVAVAIFGWRQTDAAARASHQPVAVIVGFLAFEVSLAGVAFTSDVGYRAGLFVFVSAGMLAALHMTGKRTPAPFYRISELVMAFCAGVALWQAGHRLEFTQPGPAHSVGVVTASILLSSLALAVLIGIFTDWVRLAARVTSYALRTPGSPTPHTHLEIISGTGLTVAGVGLLLPYRWFIHHTASWPLGFPVSLACMVVALVVVGLGLWSRVKSLRLYGLVVVIVCVLKLVTLDIAQANSITRVVAFLGGAAVCFGISALYNYAARQFDRTLAVEPPDMNQSLPIPPAGGAL